MNLLAPIFFFVATLGFALPAFSGERIRDLMTNRFHVDLPKHDRGTLYVEDDNEFLFFPAFDNQDYIHLCSGRWSAGEKKKTVTFRGKNKCRYLNGTYTVSHQPDGLYLHNPERNLVLKHLE
ncbi:MAG: hypothetical protein HYU99_02005 [Deltaproteobacteria bacterium]|nr:hypothetical protein [Deltaproteobacteria bacterium]